MRPISPREWTVPLLAALALILLGSLPYAYGYWFTPDDEVFMGFIGRGTLGANSYMSLARQVAEGHTFMTNLCTPEPRPHAFFHVEWWLFGMAARVTGWSLITIFHIGRVLTVLAFCLAVYYLVAAVFGATRMRLAAFLLILCGAGLGWIPYGVNKAAGLELPLVLDVQGVNVFAYLMNKPHFMRAGAFTALFMGWFLRGEATGRRGYFLLAGLACGAGGFIRPFHLPDTLLFLLAYGAVAAVITSSPRALPVDDIRTCAEGRKRGTVHALADSLGTVPILLHFLGRRIDWGALSNAALTGVGLVPALLWYARLGATNPLGMSREPFPALTLLMLTLWLGLPFAAVMAHGTWCGLRTTVNVSRETTVLALWLLAALLCSQAPPFYPYAHETYFPFVFAAPLLFLRHTGPAIRDGLARWFPWRGLTPVLVALLVAAVLPSSAVAYAKFFNDIRHPDVPWRYTLPKDVTNAMHWIETHTPEGSVVLANHSISQYIPYIAGRKILSGQDILMTQNYTRKAGEVGRFFYSPGDDGFKRWLCAYYGIGYVLLAAEDTVVTPANLPWLSPVYKSPGAAVYAVNLP